MKTANVNTVATVKSIVKASPIAVKIRIQGNSIHFHTDYGRFYATKGNTKVDCPIVSAGTGTACVNAKICPFHTMNYKESGYPQCYACNSERIYPNVKKSRIANERILRKMHKDGVAFYFGQIVGAKLAEQCEKLGVKYVRFNESSDLADWNIEFFQGVSMQLTALNKLGYTYSKSSESLVEQLRSTGATVQISEDDFVVVDSEEEAKEKGLVMCPGESCGDKCVRCPLNLKTAVLRH